MDPQWVKLNSGNSRRLGEKVQYFILSCCSAVPEAADRGAQFKKKSIIFTLSWPMFSVELTDLLFSHKCVRSWTENVVPNVLQSILKLTKGNCGLRIHLL